VAWFGPHPADLDDDPDGVFKVVVGIGGLPWHLALYPAPEGVTGADLVTRPSVVVPIALLVTVALCAAIILTLNRQNLVVQREVQERTATLEEQALALELKERELEQVNRRLLEMSHTDALTELLNRRGYEMQLDKERERAERTGQPFGLLFFDVDHFKGYNDHYGHLAGDEALKRVAQMIQSEARRIDCVARYGGEEFVVVASNTDAHGLLALGERIRSRIRAAQIENRGSPLGILTISGGGSLYRPDHDSDPRRVTEIADQCLYRSKEQGRNRITMRV
jgi:diguanylate cyclase (GGDEF)-like protein